LIPEYEIITEISLPKCIGSDLEVGCFSIFFPCSTEVSHGSDWVNFKYKFFGSSDYYNLNTVFVFWLDELLFSQVILL
jgi:hypothetical protein